jgi:hypothetical protein
MNLERRIKKTSQAFKRSQDFASRYLFAVSIIDESNFSVIGKFFNHTNPVEVVVSIPMDHAVMPQMASAGIRNADSAYNKGVSEE